MITKITLATLLFFTSLAGFAQDKPKPPVELEVLKDSIGVWDAAVEVWPQGPDAASLTFKGVETNRAYGEYWIASDFESTFMGETMKLHSIIGYDLDQKKLVGTTIDSGPYSARMTGEYDPKTKSTKWTTKVKDAEGKAMEQKTTMTQDSADKRVLVLSAPGKEKGTFTKLMQITYTKRK